MKNNNKPFLTFGLPQAVVASVLAAALVMALHVAPTEETMGDVQRILYIHVSVAWMGLLCFAVMGASGLGYLLRRNLAWDHWSHAANEVGWLCSSLTLLTGSFWANSAWGTWWTWDPRLTTMFILWALFSSCLVVRGSVQEPHNRARVAGIIAVLSLIDLPLVVMATRWFRGIHPVSPEMDPTMRMTLLLNIVAFTIFFTVLLVRRHSQLLSEKFLTTLENQTLEKVESDN